MLIPPALFFLSPSPLPFLPTVSLPVLSLPPTPRLYVGEVTAVQSPPANCVRHPLDCEGGPKRNAASFFFLLESLPRAPGGAADFGERAIVRRVGHEDYFFFFFFWFK